MTVEEVISGRVNQYLTNRLPATQLTATRHRVCLTPQSSLTSLNDKPHSLNTELENILGL